MNRGLAAGGGGADQSGEPADHQAWNRDIWQHRPIWRAAWQHFQMLRMLRSTSIIKLLLPKEARVRARPAGTVTIIKRTVDFHAANPKC